MKSINTSDLFAVLSKIDRKHFYTRIKELLSPMFTVENEPSNESIRVFLDILVVALVLEIELNENNFDILFGHWKNVLRKFSIKFSNNRDLSDADKGEIRYLLKNWEHLHLGPFLKDFSIEVSSTPYKIKTYPNTPIEVDNMIPACDDRGFMTPFCRLDKKF